jgi:hypothetical protein
MRLLTAPSLTGALAVVLSLTLAHPGLAQDAPAAMITVTGTGTVDAAPDMATLSIGVTTQDDTAAAALAANSATVEAVIARLAAAGVAAGDMQTNNLSVSPNWTGYDSASPRISGYVATNVVAVRVRGLERLGAVVDAAVADGANTLNGLTFGLAEPEPVLDAARLAAVADARRKAELLAQAAGVTLGPVRAVSEGASGPAPEPMFRAEASAVPVMGGEIGLSASVTMTFEILP